MSNNESIKQQVTEWASSADSPRLLAVMVDRDRKRKGIPRLKHEPEPGGICLTTGDEGGSSLMTPESYRTKSLFDLGDQLNREQGDITEPTSTDLGGSLAGVKDTVMEHPDVYEGAIADKNTLLRDLDVKDCPVELESDSSYGPEDETDEAPIDLGNPGDQPNKDATKALTVFEATESTLNACGPRTTTDSSSVEPSAKPSPSISDAGPSDTGRKLCTTEKSDLGYREIRIGEDNVIYRWAWGSVIEWNVQASSFPDWGLLEHATKSLQRAADEWNTVYPDAVRFVRVANTSPAVFRLAFVDSDDGHGTLATSFFPPPPPGPASNTSAPGAPPWSWLAPPPRPPNPFLSWWLARPQEQKPKAKRLYVYPLCFTAPHVGAMYNVFCHELGHVLGLRHEFAARRERGLRSLRLGPSDPLSVMEYYRDWSHCLIGALDRAGVRRFYNLPRVGSGLPLCDVVPRPVLEPEPALPVPQRYSF